MSNIYQSEKTQQSQSTESLNISRQAPDSLEAMASPSLHPPAETARQTRKGRRLRPRVIICACLLLLLLPTAVYALSLYQEYSRQYQQDLALSQAGIAHLQSAEAVLKAVSQGSVDQGRITEAHQHFANALTDFNLLQSNLAHVPAIASNVPRYGSLLASAQRIIPLAIDVSQAGLTGTDALNLVLPHLRGVLSASAPGLTRQDITTLTQDVEQIQMLLSTATTQINHLQAADLRIDARLGRAVATFRADLPAIQSSIQSLQQVLAVAPTLLGIGTPASYLIEQLDSTEVRPGGGFIGSYGLATFAEGRLSSLHLADTYLLDIPYTAAGHVIPFPANDSWFPLAPSWSLRDSNLEPDFPTDARYAEQLYHTEGGTAALQGVIAITPMLIQNALEITGPIYVSQYNETITAQNLIDRIHYHQLKEELAGGDNPSPDGISSLRKHFTAVLFEAFFARVRQIASADLQKFQMILLNALRTKDVQVYLNSSPAEHLLQNYHISSSMQAPAGDTLMVVDANIISNKANSFITYTMNDRVTLDASGNAVHSTTLTYDWPYAQESTQNNYGGVTTAYTDYLRVYAPQGSRLQAQSGWTPRGSEQIYGLTSWAGIFHLQYGHSASVTLTWTVPGAATRQGHGWQYTYLIQRQAGIAWKVHLQVILPSCAHSVSNSGAAPLSRSGTLSQYLSMNMHVAETYTCS